MSDLEHAKEKLEKAKTEMAEWRERAADAEEKVRQLESEKALNTYPDKIAALEKKLAERPTKLESDQETLLKVHEVLWAAGKILTADYPGTARSLRDVLPAFRKVIGEKLADERERKWR